jgi:hypothetical protein
MLERAAAGRYGGPTPHRAENAHGPEDADGEGNTDVKANAGGANPGQESHDGDNVWDRSKCPNPKYGRAPPPPSISGRGRLRFK